MGDKLETTNYGDTSFTKIDAGCIAAFEVATTMNINFTPRFTEEQESQIFKYNEYPIEIERLIIDKNMVPVIGYKKGDYLLLVLNIPPFATKNIKIEMFEELSNIVFDERFKCNGFGQCLLEYTGIENMLEFVGPLYRTDPARTVVYMSVYALTDGYLPMHRNIFQITNQ